jgi:hypothetical protein
VFRSAPADVFYFNFTMFSCLTVPFRSAPRYADVALHQRNAERSGTEMEERSREHFTMFSCLILHQRNTERSGTEMEVGSRKCFHCKMFYNVQLPYISVSRSGAEQRWKKGPGNILQCSVALFYISTERSGMEMERNGDGRQVQGTFASVTLMKNMARSGAERETGK